MLASWSISARIFAGFGVILALLGALALFTWTSMGTVTGLFGEYRDTARQSLFVDEWKSDLGALRRGVFQYRLTRDPAYAEHVDAISDEMLMDVGRAADYFAAGSPELAAAHGFREKIENYDAALDRYIELDGQRDEQFALLERSGAAAREALTDVMTTAYRDGDSEAGYHGGIAQQELLRGRLYATKYLLDNHVADHESATSHLEGALNGVRSLLLQLEDDQRRQLAGVAIDELTIYVGAFGKVREIIEERNAIRDAELDVIGPELQDGYDALMQRVSERQNALGPQAQAQIDSTSATAAILGVGAVAAGAALAFVIGRWIAGAVSGMALNMSRMAGGDLEVKVTGDQHKHELGEMARALKVFQSAGIEKRRLDAEAEEAAKRERELAAEQASLQSAVKDVVEAAAAGDFARRVDPRYSEEALNAFAGLVNRLIEAVRGGVSETARVMEALSRGDLSAEMRGSFEGAFAELQGNVNATVSRLRDTVGQIKASGSAIHRSTGEISQGASDLSQRAENQAASLEEIAATMEELAATVKTNAEHAAEARQLSSGASERAESGGTVVSKAVTAMSQIEESSGKIADIVSVIDGFAFQTNLLALNAAVEAARAGEAGKGFAVVASEVRQLAQRSAEAARDIKGLIDSSAERVSEGVSLVEETGRALSELMESIGRVGETIADISEASREQSAGVEEIASTISGLDETTQQNSAIADESASAAKGLADEASRLDELMRFFTTEATGGSSSRAA